jgi:mono/diheme cytochrome c family protein
MLDLPRDVSGTEARKLRREVTVAPAGGSVAGDAGSRCARGTAAECDEFATRFEGVAGRRGGATGKSGKRSQGCEGWAVRHSSDQSATAIAGSLRRGAAFGILLTAALAGCKPPPETRHDLDPVAVERGRAIVAASGCGACHQLPGVRWPQGRAGPSLMTFDGIGPIAGSLPNTPANLAAFVRNAPAAKPGTTMPAMPISRSEARDVAAYLYGISE